MIRKLQTAALALLLGAAPALAQDKILNVSYDVGREVFAALNPEFQGFWKGKSGHEVTIDQSHAGSSKQARAILEGLPADVVTFNQETDVDVLATNGLVAENWREALPNGASPFYSLPAFLVRKGNPKGIAAQYVDQGYETVTPSTSIFAAFPVAVVAENAKNSGSTEVSTAYLNWLYAPEAQEILASHNYRATDKTVAERHAADFPAVKLYTVEEVFGGWDKVQAEHLAEGGILDRVFVNQ